jgi:hypothetical protein
MNDSRDVVRTAAMICLAVVVAVGTAFTIYWTVSTTFPSVTVGGWLLVLGYLVTAVAVPTAITPVLSRVLNLQRYMVGQAWRLVAFAWVSGTAIAGLLAWPQIEPYIEPFFAGPGR